MSFPISSSAAFRSADAGSVKRIQEIHVHRDMKSSGISGCNLKGFLDDLGHTALVHLAHRVYPDAERLDHLAFARINAARPTDHCVLRQDLGRKPPNLAQSLAAPS